MQNYEDAFERLDRYIEQKMKVTNIPGMAVAVTGRQTLLRVSTYGFANVAARVPVTPETLFEIGSIGKSFTSIALLQLREEGRLDLHEPVTRYLPWFEVQSGYDPITLHHLMTHTAGITNGPEFPGDPHYEAWALRETEATAPPGTYYHYSDAGYKVLGVLLEELLGRPYSDIIQARILDPLGMLATEPIITNETRRRLAVGYEGFHNDRPLSRDRALAPATWLEHAEGAGSIASTPGDMAAYLRMLMNQGQVPRGHVLAKESFELMTRRLVKAEADGEGSYYGYGLVIRKRDGHMIIGHGGGMVGYYAHVLADMDDGLGVVVLMNGPGDHADKEVADLALNLLRAALRDQELPSLPSDDPTRIEHSAQYAGTYQPVGERNQEAGAEAFTIVAEGERLMFHYCDERVVLRRRGPDAFYVDHPDFALFLLQFGREDGRVVEAFHGPSWYSNERYAGRTTFDYPEEWAAYTGHYCSHNPWLSNFRVVLRKGALMLIHPSGEDEPMEPLRSALFRVGKDHRSPERIRFDAILDGQALRANLSCGDYYRTFTD